mmetsp:Transcript_29617/g.96766  ORF Transcript_29617/g.96766 Transcript_29617/m.96766 type:complete len:239 (+) Transcript_29617:550-1266(+)
MPLGSGIDHPCSEGTRCRSRRSPTASCTTRRSYQARPRWPRMASRALRSAPGARLPAFRGPPPHPAAALLRLPAWGTRERLGPWAHRRSSSTTNSAATVAGSCRTCSTPARECRLGTRRSLTEGAGWPATAAQACRPAALACQGVWASASGVSGSACPPRACHPRLPSPPWRPPLPPPRAWRTRPPQQPLGRLARAWAAGRRAVALMRTPRQHRRWAASGVPPPCWARCRGLRVWAAS